MALTNDSDKILTERQEQPIQDLFIPEIEKKRFRINGDDNKILEIDTNDLGILTRLHEKFEELDKLALEANTTESELSDDDDEFTTLTKVGRTLKEVDDEMRKILDDIFNANVSETCATKNLYSPENGKWFFEVIIERVIPLCNRDINDGFRKMELRANKHTAKYTKKRKK